MALMAVMSRDPWPDRRREIEWFLPVLKYRERGERRGGGKGGEEGIECLCVYRYREGKRDSGSARARERERERERAGVGLLPEPTHM